MGIVEKTEILEKNIFSVPTPIAIGVVLVLIVIGVIWFVNKKELSVKARLIIGTISLVITGIFTSCLLIEYQKDWIMLLSMIIFAILFLKCFTCEEIERPIYNRLSNIINGVSITLIIIALVLLPDSLGEMLSKDIQAIIYFISFISWFIGLYLQMIKTKYKTNEE